MPSRDKRSLAVARLQKVEESLKSTGSFDEHSTVQSSTEAVTKSGLCIVIGTSKLLEEQPDLAERLTKMIEDAYQAVDGNPLMLKQQPVVDRLQMGDGYDARGDSLLHRNRVLHVAFLDGKLAGCVSSSITTTWNPRSGHWGLLVVDLSLRGKHVASALMTAAEERIVEHCQSVQIEYEFKSSSKHSQHLEAMYTKRGYETKASFDGVVEGAEFRICGKTFTDEEREHGRYRALVAERSELLSALQSLPEQASCELLSPEVQSQRFFKALAAFVAAGAAEKLEGGPGVPGGVRQVYQLFVEDISPRVAFVLDLKNGSGSAKDGEDPHADITISMTDELMMAWWNESMVFGDGFWSGKIIVTSTHSKPGYPGTWWSDSVDKLTALFKDVRNYDVRCDQES